jgi:hypothetical protein
MPQSLEDLVEQFMEEGLSKEEAIKAAKKRFLQETKINKNTSVAMGKKEYDDLIKKQLQKQQKKEKLNKKKNKKILTIKKIEAKKGGKIGDKLVASFYKGV